MQGSFFVYWKKMNVLIKYRAKTYNIFIGYKFLRNYINYYLKLFKMNPNFCFTFSVLLITALCFSKAGTAQDMWGSWAHKIPAKGYEGKRFRMEAQVRSEGTGETSAARLWARVDNPNKDGFFENMNDRPVQDSDWSYHNIEGFIDAAASQLVIGALVTSGGRFYYDNFKVEIEMEKGKWIIVFEEDFEKDLKEWTAGIGSGTDGISQYKASTLQDGKNKSKVLLIEGSD